MAARVHHRLVFIHPFENGGFHLVGASSTGKTTCLHVAASVFGGKDYIQRWKATSNGIEGIAKMYNDLLLPLDEMGEISPKDAGEVAYMLGNGMGKGRADKNGEARNRAKFRCLFLSIGEVNLAQHMLEDGKKAKAGQETRIADISADQGPFGAFEFLHNRFFCPPYLAFFKQLKIVLLPITKICTDYFFCSLIHNNLAQTSSFTAKKLDIKRNTG